MGCYIIKTNIYFVNEVIVGKFSDRFNNFSIIHSQFTRNNFFYVIFDKNILYLRFVWYNFYFFVVWLIKKLILMTFIFIFSLRSWFGFECPLCPASWRTARKFFRWSDWLAEIKYRYFFLWQDKQFFFFRASSLCLD